MSAFSAPVGRNGRTVSADTEKGGGQAAPLSAKWSQSVTAAGDRPLAFSGNSIPPGAARPVPTLPKIGKPGLIDANDTLASVAQKIKAEPNPGKQRDLMDAYVGARDSNAGRDRAAMDLASFDYGTNSTEVRANIFVSRTAMMVDADPREQHKIRADTLDRMAANTYTRFVRPGEDRGPAGANIDIDVDDSVLTAAERMGFEREEVPRVNGGVKDHATLPRTDSIITTDDGVVSAAKKIKFERDPEKQRSLIDAYIGLFGSEEERDRAAKYLASYHYGSNSHEIRAQIFQSRAEMVKNPDPDRQLEARKDTLNRMAEYTYSPFLVAITLPWPDIRLDKPEDQDKVDQTVDESVAIAARRMGVDPNKDLPGLNPGAKRS